MDDISLFKLTQKSLSIEIDVLKDLRDTLTLNVCDVIRAIHEIKGRVIVTGVGKSALVAQKIVATFNSTGCPALFMHAADAVHGDLGMVMDKDIILCISKSGETAEIKVLLPIIKHKKNTLIAMTSNQNSTLSKASDYTLYIPVDQEADPNNLAPTASSTAQMALGDALAIALLALKGFSVEDFAQFHPGGSLGKQLYLKVEDLIQNNEVPRVQTDSGIRETIIEISSGRLGITTVLDPDGKICGVITDGDLRRMLLSQDDVSQLIAADIMTPHPKTIEKTEYAIHALQIMRDNNITQLVVTENKIYSGIIHLHDLLKEGFI